MQDQRDIRCKSERFEPRIQITGMIDEAVRATRILARVAHADQVWRKTAPALFDMGNHVSPQIRRSWVAVQKYNGITGTDVDVSYFGVEYSDPVTGVGVVG